MPRAAKPVIVLENQKRSHRTKAELELRKQAEEELKTGGDLIERDEVKKNKVAHNEFLRVKKLLEEIEKSDALYSSVINRYCQLYAECLEFEQLKDTYQDVIQEITADKEEIVEDYVTDESKDTISLSQYYKMKNNFAKYILQLDAQIMTKRKMMFDIEKENIMTVQAALRSIPKTPSQTEDPLLKALQDD